MIRNAIYLFVFSVLLFLGFNAISNVTPEVLQTAALPEIQPVNTKMGDTAQGKALAAQCSECHGLDGVKAKSGAPFIAGLKQDYLIRSLLSYRNGARNHSAMKAVVDKLKPIDLAHISAYYASLNTPWKGAVADQSSRAVLQDHQAQAHAKRLMKGCISCHEQAGRYQQGEVVPNLDGMPLEYFIPALKSYFNGERQNDMMVTFKRLLTEEDIYNVGAYFAARIPKKSLILNEGRPAKGKIVARNCAGCHGYDGNSLNPHIPNLAGQPQNYLVKAMKDYQKGARNRPLMQNAVKHLSDRTINDLAAYYARQSPESQLHKDLSSPQAFNPLVEGERIAGMCKSCHSNKKGPDLSGMHVKYFVSAMQDYQQGKRKHSAMNDITAFFSDTDIEKVAYYYAMQPMTLSSNIERSDQDHERGRSLSQSCAMCHGKTGVSPEPDVTPSLAGMRAEYIIKATRSYSQGLRQNDSMNDVATQLSDEELADIAYYFSWQIPKAAITYLPDDPAKLVVERCSRCHGDRGFSTQAGVPQLAGQLEAYIIQAMKEYQEGVRQDKVMVAMADVLSLLEIKAIAAYYAKQ